MFKFTAYIRHVFKSLFGNKQRLILTFIGFSIGIFVFSFGQIIMDSYYYAKTKEIREMPDNAFYVNTQEFSDKISEELYSVSQVRPTIETVSAASYTIYESVSDVMKIVKATIHGLTSMESVTMVNDSMYGNNMINVQLVSGRLLNNADIADNQKVCVIDEYTASILYPGKDAVDKCIYFNKYLGGEQAIGVEDDKEIVEFRIVGVIKNNYYTHKEQERTAIYSESVNQYTYVNIFCPIDYCKNIGVEDPIYSNLNYLWIAEPDIDIDSLMAQVQPLASALGKKYVITDTIDKRSEYEQVENELRPLKTGIYYASVGLAMITGLTCMSLMFFAMKERVNEIGVKKAFGASWLDILAQFLLENSIIALLSGGFAVLVSIYSARLCSDYICNNFLTDYEYYITSKNIVFPLLMSFLEGFVFTLIPSIRYSVISVTKALKLD